MTGPDAAGNLTILAGRKALARLHRNGLAPDDVDIVVGAAGGPKWLVLSQLDRVLFGSWLARRQRPLYLLGASIGSWRFAAVSRRDPLQGIAAFETAYLAQRYTGKPTPAAVSARSRQVLEEFVGDDMVTEILSHPSHRLSALAGRCAWPVAPEGRLAQALGLGSAALLNAVHRGTLRWFFEQTVFHDDRDTPPFFVPGGLRARRVQLTAANLRPALLASGAIPLVMAGVRAIPGAPSGTYRDGGIVDYHLDVPFGVDGKTVLFPHFGARLVPGWFDKGLPWRKPAGAHLDDVLLIAPSPRFVAGLPGGKVPSRADFTAFTGRDEARVAAWRAVIDRCRRLGDELRGLLETDGLAAVARPFPPGSYR